MTCRDVQGAFSELADRELPPVRHREVTLHLSSCDDCRGEYQAFAATLQALKSQPRAVLPPGLAASIASSLPAATIRRPRSPGLRRRWWALGAAAASLALAASLLFFLAREREWRRRLDQALSHAGSAARAAETASLRAAQGASALEARLRGVEASLAEARAARGEVETRLEAEIDTGRERDRTQRERIAALEVELRSSRDALQSLQDRVAAQPRVAPAPVEEPHVAGTRPASPPGGGPQEARSPRTLSLRRVGGRVELSVRGPREQVVSELLALARDPADAEAAGLAEKALENLLGAATGAPDPGAGAREPGWLQAGLQTVAAGVGLPVTPAEGAEELSDAARRQERLRVLERAWLMQSPRS